jgi:phosphopantothenoylcysteine decarboxylase/phosphopantothenate--cysteine ligase
MRLGEHTSKAIIGSRGDELKGRKIVLCMTGSVAAIKSPEIARELMRHGAEVITVMTEMAQKIVHPYMMKWSTGNPVVTELTGWWLPAPPTPSERRLQLLMILLSPRSSPPPLVRGFQSSSPLRCTHPCTAIPL